MSSTIHSKCKYFDSAAQRAEDRRQTFNFCRLPFALNVMLNLSIIMVLQKCFIKSFVSLALRFAKRKSHPINLVPVKQRHSITSSCQGRRRGNNKPLFGWCHPLVASGRACVLNQIYMHLNYSSKFVAAIFLSLTSVNTGLFSVFYNDKCSSG